MHTTSPHIPRTSLAALLGGLLLAALWVAQPVYAQSPLQGSRVAVFVSMKNLQMHAEWFSHLAAFVQMDDSLRLSEENLKLATTAQVGNYLARELPRTGAASAYNLSGDPERAHRFLRHYRPGHPLPHQPVARLLADTDWVLTLDSLHFDQELRRSVVVVSNRIVDNAKRIRTLHLHTRLTQLSTGKTAKYSVMWQEGEPTNSAFFIAPDPDARLAGRVITHLLDQALIHLFMEILG